MIKIFDDPNWLPGVNHVDICSVHFECAELIDAMTKDWLHLAICHIRQIKWASGGEFFIANCTKCRLRVPANGKRPVHGMQRVDI